MMNKWQKVLDIINEVQGTNIEMGEEFEIEEYRNYTLKMTEAGLTDAHEVFPKVTLVELMEGKYKIKPKQWMPKEGERYFVAGIEEENLYCETQWEDCDCDKLWLKRGICFKTKEEAIALTKRMLEVANETTNT